MKTANSFYWTFIDTLVYNVATIAAIVVAVYQFLIRAYNENNGNEKIRSLTVKVLFFVNKITGKIYSELYKEEVVAVPVKKVAQKRAKRS
jgi:hypothetical protein